ncbi:MAG: hypothetical protein MRK02_00550 [Candidatus Scalindua sp.]|nr:hypothetical protein [Candidatus Scalindua sp.]
MILSTDSLPTINFNCMHLTILKKTEGLDLSNEITVLNTICKGKNWVTEDPLGIGGLLCEACRVTQMIISENFEQSELLETLLDSSLEGLESYSRMNSLKLPIENRLAFRELGLSIGMRAVEEVRKLIEKKPDLFKKRDHVYKLLEFLKPYTPLIETIENCWLERSSREARSWTDHCDINMVMLATSLAPDGFLIL